MPDSTNRWTLIVVNGKKAGDPALRDAVSKIRQQGHRLDVRVTWEGGDAARYACPSPAKLAQGEVFRTRYGI